MQSIEDLLVDLEVDAKLQHVIHSILSASKEISFRVGMGAISGVHGAAETENVQGETQKKLDIISNQILLDLLAKNPYVRSVASEEEDLPVACKSGAPFLVAYDPLDGSSNIDINGQIGTIFTILPAKEGVEDGSVEQYYQTGDDQLCAGYVLYGPATILLIAVKGEIHEFTLDKINKEFYQTKNQVKLPGGTKEFAINMANYHYWSEFYQQTITDLINPSNRDKTYNMRWNGAMVGDVHRVLTRGGVFLYPSDTKNPKQPAKLRLLYEAFPMAMLVEAAGGQANTETNSILKTQLTELHQRVPVIIGDSELVNTFTQ
ncbi:class 1 fructose-bisphosphatase [Catenovulum sp. 2E275]|uniref:class 1 fructose-bisphosphatase n=1 Tax=Catenovulum sp. 2E275 TaxID=2980497 RepID=UPI0021CF5F9D|nr:class 1 fructose-bisphosphatase [Catenovulum sp. 2E275]MCU4676781.1 class 1 fructose-bisphosphatase [Catenovulum sp. 2E275]